MNTQTPAPLNTSEAAIQQEILRTFGSLPWLRLWRANCGAATFKGRVVYFGLPGQADLSGILPGGIRLEIEVKDAVGQQRDRQVAFQRTCDRMGAVYILARSVADVWRRLEQYRPKEKE